MNNQVNIICNVATVAALMVLLQGIAYGGGQQLPENDGDAIKAFFNDFKEAFNAKDVKRVKQMSDGTWDHWSKAINEGMLESVEILDITTDKQTNVITKCIAVDDKKMTYPAEVVFTLKHDGGVYSIEKMRFPESERRHEEFDNALKRIGQLSAAINNCDFGAVKSLVSFGDAADFEAELSARGLSWVKDAIDNRIKVPSVNMGVSRDGKDVITGRLNVPCARGGTNVLRKVVFKNGKIDRAAPREETKEEFLRRFEKEQAERRRQFEEERAERERKQNEEALKQLQKSMK